MEDLKNVNVWEDERCMICDNKEEAEKVAEKVGGNTIEVPPEDEDDILWIWFVFVPDLILARKLNELNDEAFKVWLESDFKIVE